MEDRMNATVHMNGICGKIKLGDSICEHQSFRSKRIPGILSNAIMSLVATYDSKVIWAMEIRVAISEIYPTSYSDKVIACRTVR
jgi:hypothetical protein